MNRVTIVLVAVIVGLISIGMIEMGRNLVMPLTEAQQKGVGAGPWFLVWGMITVLALCSLALIGFLISSLRNPSTR